MKQIKQLISGFTAFSFLLGSVTSAQTQTTSGEADPSAATGAGQVISGLNNIVTQLSTAPAVFNQTPQQLQMQAAISSMQGQMNACLTKAVANAKTVTDAKGILQKEFETVLAGTRKGSKTTGAVANTGQLSCYAKSSCESDCGEPKGLSRNFCGPNTDQEKKLISAYVDYLGGMTKCGDKDYEALKRQKEALDCQMQVLQQAVNQASQSLQQVLTANGTQYGQMNQYMGELGDQMGQISALVGGTGPDGKEIAGKWSELQKSLYENFNDMTANEGKFKNDSNNLVEQTKQNEAFLDATKAQKFGSCMFGSSPSTGAVTCWRPKVAYSKDASGNMSGQPQTNKNGCPVYEKALCSPAQAARSAIEMSYLTSNGQPYQDADRCAQAVSASANFDNVMNDISSKLGTNLNSWNDIQNAYGAQISSTALGYLQKGATVCTANADNWKKNAQNPNKAKMDKEAQQYATKKTELDNKKNELSSSLDAALTGMNKAYADVMAALSDQAVSLNTVNCTKDNPATMQKCYADIRGNLKNLLQGNGAGTTTTKTIKGGTMVPGFAAPCNGLDGCITTYRTIRDKLNDQARLANQAKQKFVQDGNTQVQQQLQSFASVLAATQQSVMKQYEQMKSAFAAMGITPPESLKTMEAEAFEQMEGPNGEKGPFKQPKSMAAVLSGMVQPGGLVNFGDTGMKDSFADALDAVKSKKSSKADAKEKWEAKLERYGECEEKRANALLADCNACKAKLEQKSNYFSALGENSKMLAAALALAKKMQGKDVEEDDFDAMAMTKLDVGCRNMLKMGCDSTSTKSVYGGGAMDSKADAAAAARSNPN